MTITVKSTKLPSGYRKVAHIEFQRQLQKWVTVAHFHSQTIGQVDVYFMYEHGSAQPQDKPKEISRDHYLSLLRKFYAVEPQHTGKEPCKYCGDLDCPTPSDCPVRRQHMREDEGQD